VWQALRSELHPQGLEVVTVALDTAGMATAGRWIEAAAPEHPALIDQAHQLDALFGIVNVPSGVWIDEEGAVVRPPEPAFPAHLASMARPVPEGLEPYRAAAAAQARKIRIEPEKYVAALRDWVARGAASPYALSAPEVVARSQDRSWDAALAAAHFELGQHLHRGGEATDAVPHFRAAHRLQPENWTYKRQAWSLADARQGPSPDYDSDWLSDVLKIGAENYYPPLQM
jgi:hypothetical protein